MNIDLQQLEMNVNLHSLQPNFLNRELYYIIAEDENNFRFAGISERPNNKEQKFYCYLTDKPLQIPAGNITLKERYILDTKPPYLLLSKAEDFFSFVDCIGDNCVGKAIRNFSNDDIESIYQQLHNRYGNIEKHLISSPEFQHLLLILPQIEISISPTMVYFKQRMAVTNNHYEHLKEEKI